MIHGIILTAIEKIEKDRIIERIISYQVDGEVDDASKTVTFVQYTKFTLACQESTTEIMIKALQQEQLSVKDFWRTKKQEFPGLLPIAMRIFSLSCTSASAERNFSLQGLIQTKFRTRLSPEKVMKLAFIKTNMKFFTNIDSFDVISDNAEEIPIELEEESEPFDMNVEEKVNIEECEV